MIESMIDGNSANSRAKEEHGLWINDIFVGYLTNPMTFDVSVDWEPNGYADAIGTVGGAIESGVKAIAGESVGNVINAVKSAGKATVSTGKLAGYVSGKSGLMGKKIFGSSQFFTWAPEVKIFDHDGTGLVMNTWKRLVDLTLPGTLGDGDSKKGEDPTVTQGIASKAQSAVVSAIGTDPRKSQDIGKAVDFEGAFKRSVLVAPDPVTVRFGGLGKTSGGSAISTMRMVIDQLGVTFSQEMLEVGPMFAVINMTLSSLEPMTRSAFPIDRSRVKINKGG